jgi:hypothetical protein
VSGPADGSTTTDPDPVFSFIAGEDCTFQVKVDSGAYTTATSPVTIGPLAPGSHTFRVRATDTAGNVETVPPHVTFTVVASTTLAAGVYVKDPNSGAWVAAQLT